MSEGERILYTGGWEAGAREVCRRVKLGEGTNPSVVRLAKKVLERESAGGPPGGFVAEGYEPGASETFGGGESAGSYEVTAVSDCEVSHTEDEDCEG